MWVMSPMVQCRSWSSSLRARVETVVEFVQVLLGLGNQPFEARDVLSFQAAALVFGVLELGPVDEGVQADFDVAGHLLYLAGSLGRRSRQARDSRPARRGSARPCMRSGMGQILGRDGLGVLRGRGYLVEDGRLPEGHLACGVRLDDEEPAVERPSPAVLHRGREDVEQGRGLPLDVEEDGPLLEVVVDAVEGLVPDRLEERVPGRDPFERRVLLEDSLSKATRP